MLPSQDQRVYGELYEVTNEELKRLDQLEGFKGLGKDNVYARITLDVHLDFTTTKAYVYVYSSQ